jgi:hypothetical protein
MNKASPNFRPAFLARVLGLNATRARDRLSCAPVHRYVWQVPARCLRRRRVGAFTVRPEFP